MGKKIEGRGGGGGREEWKSSAGIMTFSALSCFSWSHLLAKRTNSDILTHDQHFMTCTLWATPISLEKGGKIVGKE